MLITVSSRNGWLGKQSFVQASMAHFIEHYQIEREVNYMKKFIHKHYTICPLIIALLIAFMYITGLPFVLINYEVAGNNIFYIFNIILASALCIILIKALYPEWRLGFQLNGLMNSLKEYGWVGLIGVAWLLITSYYAYRPLNKIPVKGTILIWVVIYYFFVALIEELFNRGVLLNALLKGFERYKQGVIIAIFLSSIIFALGHMPGMFQDTLEAMIGKIILAFGLGIFFGCIYICTNKNLLIVILLHWMLDMSAAVFYYYSSSGNMFANVFERVLICLILAVIGLVCIAKKNHYAQNKNNITLS